jgi:pimeloyl-ACP methyl ester carboxylesterase
VSPPLFDELPEAIVRSPDGTAIAYRRIGTGRPVVVVHGTLGRAASWYPVASRLADTAEFFLVERRGRGGSGELRSPHSIGVEVGDVLAVIDRVGGSADLVGHSYGGVVALEAALRAPAVIRRLALYEPGLPSSPIPPSHLEELQRLIRRGAREDALLLFLERISTLRQEDIQRARGSAGWDDLVRLAPTLPLEVSAVRALPTDVSRYRAIEQPTLLVIGELSGERHERNLRLLRGALRDARVARLAGEGHVATVTNPDLLAAVVRKHLEAPSFAFSSP